MAANGIGGLLEAIGASTKFSAVTNIIGLAATAYGIIASIVAYAEGAPPEVSNQDVLDAIDKLELRIDDLAVELRQEIDVAVAGVQKQALLSAVARAESVHDILSSYDSDPDAVTRSQLISDASLALRDTLAQALTVAQSQTLASDATPAEVELAFSQVGVAIGAVSLALSVRAEVATRLEADEINAARIQTQFADAADFLSGAVHFLRNTIKADYSYDTNTGSLSVGLGGPQSIVFSMENGEPGTTLPIVKGTAVEIFITSTNYDQATWEKADWGTQDPLPYGPTYRLDPNASTQFLTDIVAGFTHPTGINKSRAEIHEIIGAIYEIDLENDLLFAAGFGHSGSFLDGLAGFYRSQADGVEKVLLPRIGMDDSGVLDGTAGNDLLVGGPGDDLLHGLGDDDILRGGDGVDTLNGGAGNDRLSGEGGDDQLFGEAGDDGLIGGAGDDLIDGGAGFDSAMFSGRRAEYTVASSTPGNPGSGPIELVISGPDGNDTLVNVERVFFDNVTLNLVSGNDAAADVLTGDFSVEVLADQFFNTVTENRPSDDIIHGFGGDDTIDGLLGDDTIYGDAGNDTLRGGEGRDRLHGGDGHDTLEGQAGNDILVGGAGSNRMTGGAGDDLIDGSDGNDSAVFSGNRAAYTLSAAGETIIVDGPDGHDSAVRVEALVFDDEFVRALTGTEEADVLATEQVFFPQSRDILLGLGGDDILDGGGGNDILDGGTGQDTAAFLGGVRSEFDVRTATVGSVLQTFAAHLGGAHTEGTDTLTKIEALQFSDRAFNLARGQLNHLSSVDGDRFDDVLFQNQTTGQVYFAKMVDGAFQSWGVDTGALGTDWKAVTTGDVNPGATGGAETLAQQQSTGTIYYASLDTGATTWGVVDTPGTAWKLREVADMNGDAAADAVVQNTATGTIKYAVMFNGAFQGYDIVNQNLTADWLLVGAGDINRDGLADAVIQQQSTGTTYYAVMAGGAFQSWGVVSRNLTADWHVRAVADVTGDGFADVIVQNASNGTTYFADMQNGTLDHWGVVASSVTPDWVVQGVADVDNDGFNDVVFQNIAGSGGVNAGTTYYADMGPAGFQGWRAVATSITADWHVV